MRLLMKLMTTIAFFLISISAFAGFNEIECQGNSGVANVYLEIEQPFPTNNVFKRMMLAVSSNGTQQNFQYTVSSRRYNGFNTILYQGGALRLEVDLWPDTNPRWGRSYRAALNSSDLNNGAAAVLNCQFPNAN